MIESNRDYPKTQASATEKVFGTEAVVLNRLRVDESGVRVRWFDSWQWETLFIARREYKTSTNYYPKIYNQYIVS